MPQITIAIPTRNRASLLGETLRSALAQEGPDLEVVVSDNASSDGTPALLAGFRDQRLSVFRQERTFSMHENWNFCLRKAKGRLFLLLSDDDLLLPGAAAALSSSFSESGVKLAYARALLMNSDGSPAGTTLPAPAHEPGDAFIRASLAGERQALPCITMHYTSEALKLGGYPEIGNITDLALRLALASGGEVRFHDEPLAKYRLNPSGLTADTEKTLESVALFSGWVSGEKNPLAAWRKEAAAFCAGWLFDRAVSAALRGDRAAAVRFAEGAGLYSGRGRMYRAAVSFCLLSPVRALAVLRRGLPGLKGARG